MIRFHFSVTKEELDKMNLDEWIETYSQLKYAIEFDSKRQSGDKNNPANYPM